PGVGEGQEEPVLEGTTVAVDAYRFLKPLYCRLEATPPVQQGAECMVVSAVIGVAVQCPLQSSDEARQIGDGIGGQSTRPAEPLHSVRVVRAAEPLEQLPASRAVTLSVINGQVEQ